MLPVAKLPAHRLRRRPGWFRPVPLRSRRDGWSAERQCAFLAQLYLTGSASAAARAVGMSRASAYRLREREDAESFAFAWDPVLSRPGLEHAERRHDDFRKVTNATLLARLENGLVKPVVYRGQMTAVARKPDNSTLFRLLRRSGQRLGGAGTGRANGESEVSYSPRVGGPRVDVSPARSRNDGRKLDPGSSLPSGELRFPG